MGLIVLIVAGCESTGGVYDIADLAYALVSTDTETEENYDSAEPWPDTEEDSVETLQSISNSTLGTLEVDGGQARFYVGTLGFTGTVTGDTWELEHTYSSSSTEAVPTGTDASFTKITGSMDDLSLSLTVTGDSIEGSGEFLYDDFTSYEISDEWDSENGSFYEACTLVDDTGAGALNYSDVDDCSGEPSLTVGSTRHQGSTPWFIFGAENQP